MGAADFSQLSRIADVKQAFESARTEAGHENGYGGYSGTIVEKRDFVIVDRTVRSLMQAYDFASRALGATWNDNETDPAVKEAGQAIDDKWGPAGAIPVCLAMEEVEREVKFTVDTATDREPDWKQILEAEGKLKPDDVLRSVRVIERKDRTRLEMKRTEGKAVTRYFYAGSAYGRRNGKGDVSNWLSGFLTMAEWRAHAKKTAEEYGGRYEAIAIVRRFDSEPLDVVEAVVTKRTVTVAANIVSPDRKIKPIIDGWLFFGYASS